MPRAVVLAAVRTPVGRYGGALSGVRPDDLAGLVIREVVDRSGVAEAVSSRGPTALSCLSAMSRLIQTTRSPHMMASTGYG